MPDGKWVDGWVIVWKDISQEDGFSVYLNEKTAELSLASALADRAKADLDAIEWGKEDREMLESIIKAFNEKRFVDVINEWEEWRSDKGPLDEDAEMHKVDVRVD
jgi:hypothetical protein